MNSTKIKIFPTKTIRIFSIIVAPVILIGSCLIALIFIEKRLWPLSITVCAIGMYFSILCLLIGIRYNVVITEIYIEKMMILKKRIFYSEIRNIFFFSAGAIIKSNKARIKIDSDLNGWQEGIRAIMLIIRKCHYKVLITGDEKSIIKYGSS